MMGTDLPVLLTSLSVVSIVFGQNDDVSTRCPTGLAHTSAMKLHDDTCFQFVSEEKYWHQARDHCLLNKGRLVKIDDPQTNQFIVESLNELWWRNKGVWIGLHDISLEMNWQWTGYLLYQNEPVLWTNWGRGHPGAFLHRHRDCVRMVRQDSWKWHETFCNSMRWHYRFICEYKANSSRTSDNDGQHDVQIQSRHPSPASGNRILESLSEDYEETPAEAEPQLNGLEKDSGKNGYGNGILAASISCVLLGTLVIVALFMYYRRRRRIQRQEEDSIEPSNAVKDDEDLDFDKPEPKGSARTRAVANIYVDAGATGHVKTRLVSKPQQDAMDKEDYEDENDDDGDEGMEHNACPNDSVGADYNTPEPTHIYSEIPDNGHIYEALEDVKK